MSRRRIVLRVPTRLAVHSNIGVRKEVTVNSNARAAFARAPARATVPQRGARRIVIGVALAARHVRNAWRSSDGAAAVQTRK